MNRYARLPGNGPSKATASTLCQKCLTRDIYECKAVAQERPYVPRPSRTQQLLNPKLVPKLNSDVPQDLLRKKGIADEQLAKAEQERGRKRERQGEEEEVTSKRLRSASSFSSVSTISTNVSRSLSRSPTPARNTEVHSRNRSSRSPSPLRRDHDHQETRRRVLSRSPRRLSDPDRKRRRSSVSSEDSYASDDRGHRQDSRERAASRSTRRKFQQHSPVERGRKSESRSPYRGRRNLSNDRQRAGGGSNSDDRNKETHDRPAEGRPAPKERSLSPFSKRQALTQAMSRVQ